MWILWLNSGNEMLKEVMIMLSASEALKKLKEGNALYVSADTFHSDVSSKTLEHFAKNGQEPYAIIITCSDSRVIPERIFHAAIGDLFTIRVAGNVIDDHQLGSIEYAAGHLGTKLVVVLGHTGCGAVHAAINHDPSGFIKYITDEIKRAIGKEKDDYKAALLNVEQSVRTIESSLEIQKDEEEGLRVIGAIYRIEDGTVEFY
jgi:carbonic anhydrase